jgi:hypothetical protein
MTGVHIPGIKFPRLFRSVFLHPFFQQPFIGAQRLHAQDLIVPEYRKVGIFRNFGQSRRLPCGNLLIEVDSKIRSQLFCGMVFAEMEQICGEVDHISGCMAAEAVIVILVQLQTGRVILVEGTTGHAVSGYGQAVAFGGLLYRDSIFDLCVD